MNVMDAAYNLVAAYPGGAASLAPRVGKAATTLAHEVNRTGTAKLGVETAVAISVLSQDMRILEAFAAQCGRMTLPLPEVLQEGDSTVLARLGDMLREQSHVVREVTESLADGHISGNEHARIRREVGELISTATQMLKAVEHMRSQGAAAGGDAFPGGAS